MTQVDLHACRGAKSILKSRIQQFSDLKTRYIIVYHLLYNLHRKHYLSVDNRVPARSHEVLKRRYKSFHRGMQMHFNLVQLRLFKRGSSRKMTFVHK